METEAGGGHNYDGVLCNEWTRKHGNQEVKETDRKTAKQIVEKTSLCGETPFKIKSQ